MELDDRFSILVQGAEIAQSKGVLSLNDAVVVKYAIDKIRAHTDLNDAVKVLIKTAEIAQSKGCYTLKDSYYLYAALHGIFEILPKDEEPETEKGEE